MSDDDDDDGDNNDGENIIYYTLRLLKYSYARTTLLNCLIF